MGARETRYCHLARKFEEFLKVGCQMKRKLACQEFFFAICQVLSRMLFLPIGMSLTKIFARPKKS
jgi:hypothetical protein